MNSGTKVFAKTILVNGLTGDRRKAYFRQWKITYALTFVLAVLAVVVLTTHAHATSTVRSTEEGDLKILALGLYGMQVIYALARRETLPQLRWREIRDSKQADQKNLQELTDFANSLRQESSDDSK